VQRYGSQHSRPEIAGCRGRCTSNRVGERDRTWPSQSIHIGQAERMTTSQRTRSVARYTGLCCSMLVVYGCASRGTVVEDVARHPAPIYQGPETPTMYAEAPRSVTGVIARPPSAVQTAVRLALADYSIPVTVDTPANGQIGNPDFYRSRQFMGRPMTELVSCGSGITGPNAATYRIFMSIIVTTKPDASGGTALAVLFQSTARDIVSGTTNDRLVCAGTGRVEQLLMERIRLRAMS